MSISKTTSRLILVTAVVACATLTSPAEAQRLGRAEQTVSTAGTYYRHALPGEITIQVSVVGSVRQPGLYEIGESVDLNRLVALAGGPNIDPRDRTRERDITIRILRSSSGVQPAFWATLDQTATLAEAPALNEGDTVLIEITERQRFTWRDGVAVIGGLGAVAFLIQALR
jgi:hypothetical protein